MDMTFDTAGRMEGVAPQDTVGFGPYMRLADARHNLFSVFDDLKYDRSDIDMMSPPMRRHAVETLGRMGFKQISGSVLLNAAEDIRAHIPKFHALGSSPFDITRYTPRRARDYYVLTPTQTACQVIDAYPVEDAVEKIAALMQHQPINLFKLADYLDGTAVHREFEPALGYLKRVQREAIATDPLCRRRALGSI